MKRHPIFLFTPGNRKDFIAKAPQYGPDAIIIDLEDALANDLKERIRLEIADLIPTLDTEIIVRVNHEPQYLEKDLEAVVSEHIQGIIVPKVETIELIMTVDEILNSLERKKNLRPKAIRVIIGIETALGVIRSFELASASPRIDALFCASGEEGDLQTSLMSAYSGLLYARSKVLLDARAAGKAALDGVFTNIKDEEGLKQDCIFSKQLGYDGRALIHPKHIAIARQIYSPTAQELDHYRRMLQAFTEAESRGSASISFEGKMVDYAMIKRAKAELGQSPGEAGSG